MSAPRPKRRCQSPMHVRWNNANTVGIAEPVERKSDWSQETHIRAHEQDVAWNEFNRIRPLYEECKEKAPLLFEEGTQFDIIFKQCQYFKLSEDVNTLQRMLNAFKIGKPYGHGLALPNNSIDGSYPSSEHNTSPKKLTSLRPGQHRKSSFKKGIDSAKCRQGRYELLETLRQSKKNVIKNLRRKAQTKPIESKSLRLQKNNITLDPMEIEQAPIPETDLFKDTKRIDPMEVNSLPSFDPLSSASTNSIDQMEVDLVTQSEPFSSESPKRIDLMKFDSAPFSAPVSTKAFKSIHLMEVDSVPSSEPVAFKVLKSNDSMGVQLDSFPSAEPVIFKSTKNIHVENDIVPTSEPESNKASNIIDPTGIQKVANWVPVLSGVTDNIEPTSIDPTLVPSSAPALTEPAESNKLMKIDSLPCCTAVSTKANKNIDQMKVDSFQSSEPASSKVTKISNQTKVKINSSTSLELGQFFSNESTNTPKQMCLWEEDGEKKQSVEEARGADKAKIVATKHIEEEKLARLHFEEKARSAVAEKQNVTLQQFNKVQVRYHECQKKASLVFAERFQLSPSSRVVDRFEHMPDADESGEPYGCVFTQTVSSAKESHENIAGDDGAPDTSTTPAWISDKTCIHRKSSFQEGIDWTKHRRRRQHQLLNSLRQNKRSCIIRNFRSQGPNVHVTLKRTFAKTSNPAHLEEEEEEGEQMTKKARVKDETFNAIRMNLIEEPWFEEEIKLSDQKRLKKQKHTEETRVLQQKLHNKEEEANAEWQLLTEKARHRDEAIHAKQIRLSEHTCLDEERQPNEARMAKQNRLMEEEVERERLVEEWKHRNEAIHSEQMRLKEKRRLEEETKLAQRECLGERNHAENAIASEQKRLNNEAKRQLLTKEAGFRGKTIHVTRMRLEEEQLLEEESQLVQQQQVEERRHAEEAGLVDNKCLGGEEAELGLLSNNVGQKQTFSDAVNEEPITNARNSDECIDEIEGISEVINAHEYIDEIEAAAEVYNGEERKEANTDASSVPTKARSQAKSKKLNRELRNLKSNLGNYWKLNEEVYAPNGNRRGSRRRLSPSYFTPC